MRWKIIAVNSVVVLLVGLLSYALLRASLGDVLANPATQKADAERAISAASSILELDGLRTERWLLARAADRAARDPFKAGVATARSEAATDFANRTRAAALANPALAKLAPTLVALVDAQGIALGRDGSTLMRGADVGAAHPTLKAAIASGTTVSDLWADASSAELMLVGAAPVRDENGQVLGLLVMGTPLNDGRLQRTSEVTSGRALLLGFAAGQNLEVKAKSNAVSAALVGAVAASPVREAALGALGSGQTASIAAPGADAVVAAAPLAGYGAGTKALLVVAAPASLVESIGGLLWPILGVCALGLVLVFVGGALLDNYISRPIEEIEEGLLAILNGRSDLRFEIEHAELGGLVFRLNSLLNQLMGVAEDDTDDEGRPSRPPSASDFSEALSVDETSMTATDVDPAVVAALRAEPAAAYYARLYSEYMRAKQAVGDPVGHITEQAFVARIRESESDLGGKHGRPVRYRVEVRGREVVLLAIPLG